MHLIEDISVTHPIACTSASLCPPNPPSPHTRTFISRPHPQAGMQNLDGTMVVQRSGPVPQGTNPPGAIQCVFSLA